MSALRRIRLTAQAENDFLNIATWTKQAFGTQQSDHYIDTLLLAIEAIASNPNLPGVRVRDDLAPGACTLHAARSGRKARHFIVFKKNEPDLIDILRVLHDSMDLQRHL